MPFSLLNPWFLLAALIALGSSFAAGVKVGGDLSDAKHMAEIAKQQEIADKANERAGEVAKIYGKQLLESQDTVFNLRNKLNESRGKLAKCDQSGGVRFTNDFVGLRNESLQAIGGNSAEPAGSTAGAGVTADELIEQDIENGRRWKACRTQLNALIDILEQTK